MTSSTTTRIISTALVTLALTASAADAAPTHDSGTTRAPSAPGNADRRDLNALAQERYYSSYAGATDHSAQDLRSPDARDASAGRGTFNAPDVAVVKLTEPAAGRADGGFDWRDAGIGAGTLLGAVALGLGGGMTMHRRRRGTRTAIAG